MSNTKSDIIIDYIPHQKDQSFVVLHHLPFCIQYDGPAKVRTFFQPIQSPLNSEVLYATFRGRILRGKSAEVPQEYKIVVFRDEVFGSEGLRWSVRGVSKSLTIWSPHTDNTDLYFTRMRAYRSNKREDVCLQSSATPTANKDNPLEPTVSDENMPPAENQRNNVPTQTRLLHRDITTAHKDVLGIARRWIDLARVVRGRSVYEIN
jgi:hypothetical protein